MGKRIIQIDIETAKSANYREKLQHAAKGRDTFKIPLDNIAVVDEWNDREDFGDIHILAEGIVANKGTDNIDVKFLEDGTCLLIDGERRHLAYLYIRDNNLCDEEWTKYMLAFAVPADASVADLMAKKLSGNNIKRFEPFEEASAFNKCIAKGMTEADIARRYGTNRMQVNNRLILNLCTPPEREMIKEKVISVTEWTKLAKAIPDMVVRINKLYDYQKRPDMKIDVFRDLVAMGYEITEEGEAIIKQVEEAAAEQEQVPDHGDPDPIVDDIKGITDGEYAKNIEKGIEKFFNPGQETGIKDLDPDKKNEVEAEPEPEGGLFKRSGLAALLNDNPRGLDQIKSTIPAVEPAQETPVKTKGITAAAMFDDVGSTLGPEDKEEGTVAELLKGIAVLMKGLDRQIMHDSKMSDVSFKIDKKLRHVQKIVKSRPELGNLEWDEALQTAVTVV